MKLNRGIHWQSYGFRNPPGARMFVPDAFIIFIIAVSRISAGLSDTEQRSAVFHWMKLNVSLSIIN
jgi:hypothetical protein